jgi:hypothetical protein
MAAFWRRMVQPSAAVLYFDFGHRAKYATSIDDVKPYCLLNPARQVELLGWPENCLSILQRTLACIGLV